MAPVTQYVFAEMLGISEHFTAGSHEWLPYSVIPTLLKLICKHQFIFLPLLFDCAYYIPPGAVLQESSGNSVRFERIFLPLGRKTEFYRR